MKFLNNILRVRRAGKIRQDKAELKELNETTFKTSEERKRQRKLEGRIGRNEERNRIASEKETKKYTKSITNNISKTDSHNTEIVGAKVEQASLLSVNKQSKQKSKPTFVPKTKHKK